MYVLEMNRGEVSLSPVLGSIIDYQPLVLTALRPWRLSTRKMR